MLWGEASKWAKKNGYKISKKEDKFSWNKIDDVSKNGIENNLKEVVKKVYNEITEYKYLKHQQEYKP
jgi:hypothetical protein